MVTKIHSILTGTALKATEDSILKVFCKPVFKTVRRHVYRVKRWAEPDRLDLHIKHSSYLLYVAISTRNVVRPN